MKCSICGTPRQEDAAICPTCGCRYRDSAPMLAEPPKKHHPILIPVLILTVLFVAGLALFFLFPMESDATFARVEATAPPLPEHKTETPSQLPTEGESPAVQTDCFTLADGVLYFDAEAYTGGRVLQIPDSIDGQTVLAIGEACFYDCDELTTILLPTQLQAIGPRAFAECDNLRGMCVPQQVTYISADAFLNCASLEALYIPTGVSRIESGAFDGCAAMRYIFYNGMYEAWNALYSDYITPFTIVTCWDGDYLHGAN